MAQSKITALITHHINDNDDYLNASIEAALWTRDIDFELFVISDSEKPPQMVKDPRIQFIWDSKLVGVADKWRECLKLADPEAKLFLSISDDVMISKHLMAGMAEAMGNQKAIMGPLSNCDNGSRYFAQMPFPRKDTLERLGDQMQVVDYPRGQTILLPQDWIGFYCVMMPKSVIEQVGELDQKMEVRGNDVDFCFRARKLGIPSLIHLGCFGWHAGDRTIPRVATKEAYDSADEALRDKYRVL